MKKIMEVNTNIVYTYIVIPIGPVISVLSAILFFATKEEVLKIEVAIPGVCFYRQGNPFFCFVQNIFSLCLGTYDLPKTSTNFGEDSNFVTSTRRLNGRYSKFKVGGVSRKNLSGKITKILSVRENKIPNKY